MASENRHDRHRSRQRGAGARSVATQFGFSLALPVSISSSSLVSASPSNEPSRTPSPRVELHPTTHPKSQPTRRKAPQKASSLAAPPVEIAAAAATAKPTRKRKRCTTAVAEQDSVLSLSQISKPALPPTSQPNKASPELDAKPRRKKRAPKTAPSLSLSVDNISESPPPPKKKARSSQRVPTPPPEQLRPQIAAVNETRHTAEPSSPTVPVTTPKRQRLTGPTTQLQQPVARIQSLHMRTVSVDQLHAPVHPPSPKTHPTARKPESISTKRAPPAPEPLDEHQGLSLRSPNLPDPPPTKPIRSRHKGKLLSSNQTRPRLRNATDDWQKEDWFEASVPASLLQVQGSAPSRLKFRF